MKFLILMAVLAAPMAAAPAFRLEGSQYSWTDFEITQVPAEVECRFAVLKGNPTVHLELLRTSEFRRFDRGHKYEILALSPVSRGGAFRKMIRTPGLYTLMALNEKGAPAAIVSMDETTNLNPMGSVTATELPPHRRLAVILISFALFFSIVTWAGLKMLKAIRN